MNFILEHSESTNAKQHNIQMIESLCFIQHWLVKLEYQPANSFKQVKAKLSCIIY